MEAEEQMKSSLLAVLNDTERLLVSETEYNRLAGLDEDEAIVLETRIRRARNKYVGQYRRVASAAVGTKGGRGKARPENARARLKAEAFEGALSRVSRRVAVLARQAAAELRAERLAAAAAGSRGGGPVQRGVPRRASATDATPGAAAASARALRSPRTEKRRAGTQADGARRQAKKDSRSAR
jgi:hypothetical protein